MRRILRVKNGGGKDRQTEIRSFWSRPEFRQESVLSSTARGNGERNFRWGRYSEPYLRGAVRQELNLGEKNRGFQPINFGWERGGRLAASESGDGDSDDQNSEGENPITINLTLDEYNKRLAQAIAIHETEKVKRKNKPMRLAQNVNRCSGSNPSSSDRSVSLADL